MGTHTVRTDCLKCNAKESYVFSYSTKDPFSFDAFCLNCGLYYKSARGKLDKEELKELRKEYDWKNGG